MVSVQHQGGEGWGQDMKKHSYEQSYTDALNINTFPVGEDNGDGTKVLKFKAAIQVKTGVSVNESVTLSFLEDRGRDYASRQQQLRKNNFTRSSSQPIMISNTLTNENDSHATVSNAVSDRLWSSTMANMGVSNGDDDEPLSFRLDHLESPENETPHLWNNLLDNINDRKMANQGIGLSIHYGKMKENQRRRSEPTLSLLADVFDEENSTDVNNENSQLGSFIDGWASPPPADGAPQNSSTCASHLNGNPSRKRSSSEPFMLTDELNGIQHLEQNTEFYNSRNITAPILRSSTAPPEWGGVEEEECIRKAKRSSFSVGDVVIHDQRCFDENSMLGKSPPVDSTASMMTSGNSPQTQQTTNNNSPALTDFTLALCAVQETQTNLRNLQPLLLQLGNIAAIEELSVASKLTASASQYILASDIPNGYACLNDAWERIEKLETLSRTPTAVQLEKTQHQHNYISDLHKMLTDCGIGSPSSREVSNHTGPLIPSPHFQFNPTSNADETFAEIVLASAQENERFKRTHPDFDGSMSSRLRHEAIAVSTTSPLTSTDYKQSNTNTPSTPTYQSHSSSCSPRNSENWNDLPPPSSTDPEIIMKRLQALMERTQMSQKRLQKWDRRNGLPKSHSQTMVNSSRSRKQLQKGVILKKWNGDPLI